MQECREAVEECVGMGGYECSCCGSCARDSVRLVLAVARVI